MFLLNSLNVFISFHCLKSSPMTFFLNTFQNRRYSMMQETIQLIDQRKSRFSGFVSIAKPKLTFDELLSAKEKELNELKHLASLLKQRIATTAERIEEFNRQKASNSFRIEKSSIFKTGTRLVRILPTYFIFLSTIYFCLSTQTKFQRAGPLMAA